MERDILRCHRSKPSVNHPTVCNRMFNVPLFQFNEIFCYALSGLNMTLANTAKLDTDQCKRETHYSNSFYSSICTKVQYLH